MKVLHLVQDEKFIDFFARSIDISDCISHRYIVYKPNLEKALRHIRKVNPFRQVDDGYFPSELMNEDLANCDVLVIHFLTTQGAIMINAAPAKVKVVWSGWGADYYHLLPGGEKGLLGPETHRVARELDLKRAKTNPLLHARLILRPIRRFYVHHTLLMPAIRRVDLFSSPIPEDYVLIKNHLSDRFFASYIQLNYGSVADTFALGNEVVEKKNILVGNSATLTNNHIEVFKMLANYDLADRKIIVPLSYGDADYRNIIVYYGQKIFGSKFQPIIDFMPLDDYNKLISTCSCAIMNNYRQQALGNIGAMLYGGSKLFLNSKNITSEFFTRRGAHISDVEELVLGGEDVFSELSTPQKNKNIKVLEEFWGELKIAENSLEFIKKIRG